MRKYPGRIARKLIDGLFPDRQFYVRSEGRVKFISVSRWTQVTLFAVLVAGIVWTIFVSMQFAMHSDLISSKNDRIRELKLAYADLGNKLQATKKHFRQTTSELESKHRQLVNLVAQKNDLEQKLARLSKDLANVSRQRFRAIDESALLRRRIEEERAALSQHISELRNSLQTTLDEKSSLTKNLVNAQTKVDTLVAKRDQLSRSNQELDQHIKQLSHSLDSLRTEQQRFVEQITERTADDIEELASIISHTGLDLERLLAKDAAALGGPLVPLDLKNDDHGLIDDHTKRFERTVLMMEDRLARWESLQRILKILPIAEPADNVYVSSRFGRRRDPFTKQWAMHGGIDLAGPRKQPIYATSPGKVVKITTHSPYGKLIVLDHGYGLKTRYGHLRKILVKKGQFVEFRQKIGTMGNSGRSTGSHLHYEVRFNDKVVDPARFLKAGRHVFKG